MRGESLQAYAYDFRRGPVDWARPGGVFEGLKRRIEGMGETGGGRGGEIRKVTLVAHSLGGVCGEWVSEYVCGGGVEEEVCGEGGAVGGPVGGVVEGGAVDFGWGNGDGTGGAELVYAAGAGDVARVVCVVPEQ